jgi:hypothetical protein
MLAKKILLGTFALLLTGAVGFAAARSVYQEPVEPTKEHEWLKNHVGKWNAKVGGMMGESEGACTIESGPGGLWNVSHFESTMMGQPFTGMEILGYDSLKGKFVSVWVDSMSHTLSVMEGTYDAATKKLVMKGESLGMDGEVAEMTNTTEYGDDKMAFTMGMEGPDGGVVPTMTIDYSRKK